MLPLPDLVVATTLPMWYDDKRKSVWIRGGQTLFMASKKKCQDYHGGQKNATKCVVGTL